MKLSHFHIVTMGLMAGLSAADGSTYDAATGTGIVWAQNVSQERGWYDANKIDNNDGDADDNMCYAASAANLIAWWQNGEYGQNLTSSAPRDIDDIWQTYVTSNDNKYNWSTGGKQGAALNWWVSGVYLPQTDADMERFFSETVWETPLTFEPFEGYYFDQYGLTKSQLGALINETWIYGYTSWSISAVDFRELFYTGSCIALTIYAEGAPWSHAITMWGAEYEKGELTALWLTDSDDYTVTTDPRLFKVEAELTTDENGVEKIFLDKDAYGEGFFIAEVYALNASASKSWQLVPEPTSATLSLLALASLAARRRRN